MNAEHLISLLTLEIFTILAVSRLLGAIFRRLGQPQVVGEIIAGILLGPSFFGWLAPSASAALFPSVAVSYLKVLSEYGVIFFMFLVGLELDPQLLRGRGRTAVATAQASIAVPFLLGIVLASWAYDRLAPPGVHFLVFAFFMGAAMSVTAFPVLARILIERDLLRTMVGAVTVTCAAVDDLTAWCLLAFLMAGARSASFATAVETVALTLAYVAFLIVAVRPVLGRMTALYSRAGRLSQNLVGVVFLLVLGSGLITDAIGVHAIFGAFMLGAIMPKEGPFVRELVEKIEDFAVVFLLPIYFAYTGLRTDFGLMTDSSLWGGAAAIIAVATLGKFGGSTIAARLSGIAWREAAAIGVLMNTRGLMELIILNIGLDLGIISPPLFAMMVLMAISTTMATTPVLSLIYPPERFRTELAAIPPAPRAALVAVALPRSGPLLLDVAAALIEDTQVPLYVLHLVRPPERGTLGVSAVTSADPTPLVPTLEHAAERGLRVRPVQFLSQDPADDICDVARAKGARLIVMGWHKPVWSRTVLGGTVHSVMRDSHADVVILIDRGLVWPPRRVLVPLAGSDEDRATLRLGTALARGCGAGVTVLAVVRPGSAVASVPWQDTRVVESMSPVDTVISEAAGHDLVVLAADEGWELAPHAFGLRSERMAAECPCSLLVVHGQEPELGVRETVERVEVHAPMSAS